MPELPEVETVRAGIERHVVGRTVATAEVLNPRAVRRDPDGPEGFAAAMSGRTFLRAERRGKYLWFDLDDDVDGSRVARPMAKPAIVSGAKPAHLPGGRPPVPPDVRRGAPHEQALDDNVDGSMEAPAEALLAHLGMSGQLLVGDAGRELSSHVRARFTFTDGGPDLRFNDQRTFGHLMLCSLREDDPPAPPGMAGASPPHTPPRGDTQKPRAPRAVAEVKALWLGAEGTAQPAVPKRRVVPAPIAHIAPDPLEEAFDPKGFEQRLAHKKTEIKRALLDQSLISGIGNIYADEALWRARLHWARPAQTLRPSEVSVLLDAVRAVLGEALVAGGTSFDALYVNVNGESGYFDRSLNAYGREGEPCPRCGSPIRRDAFMNRSSYSCPHCQKPSRARPPRPRLADAPKVG